MFKKDLLKRIVAVAMIGLMSFSLVACGEKDADDKSDKTTASEEVSEKDTTEEDTTEEDVTEMDITDDDTTEENLETADGTDSFNGITFAVPEGFEKDASSDSTSVTYVNTENAAAFVMAVDNKNVATEAVAVETFDAQIKSVFGEHVTSSSVTYNGNKATEWVTDAEDGSYKGRSLVICDGSVLLYLEYVSYTGDISGYSVIADSITY